MADRRDAIAAAMESVEQEEIPTQVVSPPNPDEGQEQVQTEEVQTDPENKEPELPGIEPAEKPTGEKPAGDKPVVPDNRPAELRGIDKPPESWKPAGKAKWATIDPEVKREIMRREKDTNKLYAESTQARQLASDLSNVVQPFLGRLQSLNAHPLHAIQELLKADYLLSSAPKAQRAQFMAKLITDYDVDIEALDSALAGKAPVDETESKLDKLLQSRLAPFNEFVQKQQSTEQQRAQAEARAIGEALSKFEDNPTYPYYEQVRDEMADIIELSAKRGVYITLEEAYNKAIQLDPAVSKELATKSTATRKASQAASAHADAQRALHASGSVGGAPSSTSTRLPAGASRRDIIAASLDSIGR